MSKGERNKSWHKNEKIYPQGKHLTKTFLIRQILSVPNGADWSKFIVPVNLSFVSYDTLEINV